MRAMRMRGINLLFAACYMLHGYGSAAETQLDIAPE